MEHKTHSHTHSPPPRLRPRHCIAHYYYYTPLRPTPHDTRLNKALSLHTSIRLTKRNQRRQQLQSAIDLLPSSSLRGASPTTTFSCLFETNRINYDTHRTTYTQMLLPNRNSPFFCHGLGALLLYVPLRTITGRAGRNVSAMDRLIIYL